MYDNKASHINWREQDLYGSSRLGMFIPNVRIGTDSSYTSWNTMGLKRYELANHLGNVMATITDRRLQAGTSGDTVVTKFDAEVVNAQDYNSFGSIMEGRQLSTADSALYRYGFNGKENDNDVGKGIGGEQDYGERIYDPRLGRFLSMDPLAKNYPHSSPYAFAENDVISAIDLEGLEKYTVTARAFIPMSTLTNPWYSPNFTSSSFAGDDRLSYQLNATTYRTEQKINIDFDKRSITYVNNTASGSKGLDRTGKVIQTSKSGAAGPTPTYNHSFLTNSNTATIYLSVDAPNRLVTGAPAINYQFNISITPSQDKKSFDYKIMGASDGFPAYEVWITDKTNNKSYLLLNRNPIESKEGPASLFPPMEHKYDLGGDSKNQQPTDKVSFKSKKNSPTTE